MTVGRNRAIFIVLLATVLSSFPSAGCGNERERGAVLYVAERSPGIPGARVDIALPADGQVFPGDRSFPPELEGVSAELRVSGFELGARTDTPRADEIANSRRGQHVHLIVDNRPYTAVYDLDEVAVALAPGPHTLFAFAGRSYHESVKTSGAGDFVNFYVGDDSGEIMLDFYLVNVELGSDGYTARYTIVGKEDPDRRYSIDIDRWVPAFASGLESGTYSVTLELLRDGEPVGGEWNSTTREIVVVTVDGGN